MRNPFKMKYTNGKKSDSSAFPFKSSPVKELFAGEEGKDVADPRNMDRREGGWLDRFSTSRIFKRKREEEVGWMGVGGKKVDVDPRAWRKGAYAQASGVDPRLNDPRQGEVIEGEGMQGPPPEEGIPQEEMAQAAQGDISSKEEQPIVQNVTPKTLI